MVMVPEDLYAREDFFMYSSSSTKQRPSCSADSYPHLMLYALTPPFSTFENGGKNLRLPLSAQSGFLSYGLSKLFQPTFSQQTFQIVSPRPDDHAITVY
jgi:hypothetical protein